MPLDITPIGVRTPYDSKRHHIPEDDNTFAPPALSAYSIALLSDKAQAPERGPEVSGLYDLEIGENLELKNSLKSKLSVHFKESTYRTENSNSHNSHNISHNLSNHNLSNHNLSSLSNHSSSNVQTEENDDMDLSGDSMAKSLHVTTPGSVSSVHTRPSSSGFTSVKRSRLARRFKSLGPPKRASEVSAEQVPETPSLASPPVFSASSSSNGTATATVPNTPPYVAGTSPANEVPGSLKRSITSDSSFFKGLEKLRQASPGLDLLAHSPKSERKLSLKPEKHSSSHNVHDFQVFLDKRDRPSVNNPFQKTLSGRTPLHSISPSTLNVEKEHEGFRKPKAPSLSFREQPPMAPAHKFSAPASQPVPLVALATDLSAQVTQEDYKRRKIIQIKSSQYEKLELMGRGGSSKVYKVRSLENKRAYAIKKVSFDQFDDTCVRGFKGEIDLLTKLKDEPRVVKLVDHAVSDGSIYLVMECGDLDLAHVFLTKLGAGSSLDLNFVRFHAMEILHCVEAVHRAGIVHSDLKPANFLFVRGMLKIIDFGIANAVPDHTANIYRESQIGTPNYMAPEALVEVNHTLNMPNLAGTAWKVGRPSDIWSCGCIIYQMIYGRPPYGSYSGQLRIMAIMNPQIKIQYPSQGIGGVVVPLSSIELMEKCFARNPNDRWTVDQCLNSDFLKPKAVNRTFVRDLVYSAVNFGYNSRQSGGLSDDVYDKLVETVLKQIEDLNYT